MTEEAKVPAEGAEAPAAEEQPKSIFEELREKVAAGETVFPTAGEEEVQDAKEESPPEGEEAAAGEEGDLEGEGEGAAKEEAEGGEGGEKAGDEDEGGITVVLPGRNAGEEVEFVVETKEDQEALQRLRNGYMRGEEARRVLAQAQADRDEIEEIDTLLATDPAGFILDKVGKDIRLEVVKALLLDEEIFKAVLEEEVFSEDTDEKDRKLARMESEEARRKLREANSRKLATEKAARNAVKGIHDRIQGMMPEGMDEEKGIRFQRAALSTAEAAVNKLGRLKLTDDELVVALREDGILDRFGIEPGSNGKALGKKTPGKAPESPVEALKKARARRKNVAASSPSGVGSPPSSVALPKNQSIKERIATVRQKGIGNILRGGKR